MTEALRNLVGWLIIRPITAILMLILWLPTLGNSAEWFDTFWLKLGQWEFLGRWEDV